MLLTIKDISFEPILAFTKVETEVPPPYASEPNVGGGGYHLYMSLQNVNHLSMSMVAQLRCCAVFQ